MPTKQTSTSTNTYNPASMGTYNGMQGGIGSTYNQFMQNPASSPWVQLMRGQNAQNAQAFGQRGAQNVARNAIAGGFGGGNLPAFMQGQMAQQGRATSAMQASGDQNALLQGYNMQMNAANSAAGYKPLQTGGTEVKQTSGLGTWLPQMISGGMGALTAGFGGGAPSSFAGGAPMSASSLAMPSPSGGFANYGAGSLMAPPSFNSPQFMPGGSNGFMLGGSGAYGR